MDASALTVEEAAELLPEINTANAAYAAGDHWQNGDGYSGPLLPSDNPLYSTWLSGLERIFVSRDVLKEIRQRDRRGLTGKAWKWQIISANADQPLAENEQERLTHALTEWIQKADAYGALGDAIEDSTWAGVDNSSARGVLRLYVSKANRNEDGSIPQGTLEESLARIQIEAPDPSQAAVISDKSSGQRTGVYLYTVDDEEAAEIVYLMDGQTVIRSVEDQEETAVDLGGRLTMAQIERPTIVDASLRSQQKFLNHAWTAYQAAIGGAGWPEDFFYGLLPPGEWIQDDDGSPLFVPEPLRRGPGSIHFLQPDTVIDRDGKETAVSAGHTRVNPADHRIFIETVETLRAAMLGQAQQEHVLLTGLSQASGDKIELAKGDFEASLSETARQVSQTVSWILETALLLAGIFSNEDMSHVRVNVEVQIDTGVVTSDQKQKLSELAAGGFLSHESALAEAGYLNPAAEVERVRSQAAGAAGVNHE